MTSRFGTVYFAKPIGMPGPIKIGCSSWPADRIERNLRQPAVFPRKELPMNDIFAARRSEIEAEAEKLGTTPEALVDKLQDVVTHHGRKLPHTMRAVPMTMRAQFSPADVPTTMRAGA